MTERLGIGVVGAGAIGIRGALRHLSQPDVGDRVRLAAICDPVPGRAKPRPTSTASPRTISPTKNCSPTPTCKP